jgi:SAM-dependent methyltransferase
MTDYTLAQAGAEEHERRRLGLGEQAFDPISLRMLDDVGIEEGWRCLDVGAGSGSITQHLAERVGPSGSVLAVDTDTRLLEPLAGDRIEVRSHDLLGDPLPEAAFELVHARNLLMHLPSRLDALRRMLHAVAPGGVLAICDHSVADVEFLSPSVEWRRTWAAFLDALVAAGWDPRYGDRLTSDLEALGLVEVRGEYLRRYERGGTLWARLLSGTIERLRPRMDASPDDVDAALRALADPASAVRTGTVVSAWGRRP